MSAIEQTGAAAASEEEQRVRLRQLLEFASDGYVVTDAQGVVIDSNQAATVMLRCPKEFVIGKPLGLFVAQGDRGIFYQALSRLNGTTDRDELECGVARPREQIRVIVFLVFRLDMPGEKPLLRWLMRDVTSRRRAEAEQRQLLDRIVMAQEDERRRVARELHDSFGQLLSALLLSVRAVRDSGPLPSKATARLDDVQRVADELGRASHELAVRLRPTVLDDVGLSAALGQLLHDWSGRSGVAVEYREVALGDSRLPAEVETALYRVVQECLTNVARHAAAGRVSVVLSRHDGRAVLVVQDDGVGFDPEAAAASGRLGLVGMRERMTLVGGDVEIETASGRGATVVARAPLHPDA